MRELVIALLLVSACQRQEDAKDREIRALRAQLAAPAPPAPPAPRAEDRGAPQRTASLPEPEPLLTAQLDRLDQEGPRTDEALLALIDRADRGKKATYSDVLRHPTRFAGLPWRMAVRVQEISTAGGLTVARGSLDYYGRFPIYVYGRFATPFRRGSPVEVVGYLAGNHREVAASGRARVAPALAARAIVKYGTIDKLKAARRKARGTLVAEGR